ncbi:MULTISPECIES: hypothetical protein [unclassified Streptomyces]|uniref:hypothetical protein n=1 Tax=unclassified Streptomyces TaxID=2593676 RepID=UPI001F04B8F3|nr:MULTISPECIES: hypothetical protein [unclassified Streptomyces]MCH0563260.1 hypothetical protein [Streptomyces sp. MUM 2J]MCH0568673.1 hypothetical protein [Streptomyces sp. MUM 136J]
MAHTFDELVEKQRAANEAHARVLELRDTFGAPTTSAWTGEQHGTYETAWRAWRDLAREAQGSVTEYAKGEGKPRNEVEAEVKRTAQEPPTGEA